MYEALEARRRGDLAVHLYNAFALKGKRRRIGPGGELVSLRTCPLVCPSLWEIIRLLMVT